MLQVARTLGYTTLNRIGEVMVFLKNPEASNEKQEAMLKRFPPGVVLFFNNVEGP